MHQSQLNTLQRPKLLIRAARAAMPEFQGERGLRPTKTLNERTNSPQFFDTLLQEECRLNEERIAGDASYSVRKHIRALTALMTFAAGPASNKRAA